ncbi:MAG TPA: hypothetical protein V6C57_19505, partial [Coleofasciculaceae cyanobacterium]
LDYPQIFVVHQSAERGEIYVCLFAAPPPEMQVETSATQPTLPCEPVQPQSQIASRADLEAALVTLLRDLAVQSNNKPIPIAELQTRFQKQQGQPIKQVFQRLNIGLRYITFLESCRAFKLEKMEKGWLISLANP